MERCKLAMPRSGGETYGRRIRIFILQAVLLLAISHCCWAESADSVAPPNHDTAASAPVRIYRSDNFRIHSDLAEDAAQAMLVRMESTLRQVSNYWRRPLQGTIEAFVVDDLTLWSMEDLPHPMTRLLLEHVGGVTIPNYAEEGERSKNRAVIYATARSRVVQHEVVHAYCCQTFGTCGPDWYKEGMADLICLLPGKQRSVRCPEEAIAALHNENQPSIQKILDAPSFTASLFDVLKRAASLVEGDDLAMLDALPTAWGMAEDAVLRKVKQSYAQSWALCHFLALNKNYSQRFRRMGLDLLQGVEVEFDQVFAADRQRLDFEFERFLTNMDQGYRVDLCRWEWDKSFVTMAPGRNRSLLVQAAAGYQPTGCSVTRGATYKFHAEGSWQIAPGGDRISAKGASGGSGRLSAAVLSNYQLGNEFALGESGEFVADVSGELYVRCQDSWNEIADNAGIMRLRLARSE